MSFFCRQHRPVLLATALLALLAATAGATPPATDNVNTPNPVLQHLEADYREHVDKKRNLVYRWASDRDTFDRTRRVIEAWHDAHRAELFPGAFDRPVTIVLPTLADYRRLKLPENVGGLYHGASRTLISISISSILGHEFTHALHHHDQLAAGQEHALWAIEGLAMLYQFASVKDGRFDIHLGPMLETVQTDQKNDTLPPLATLLTLERKGFMADATRHYAAARYLTLYLYRKGKLADFYAAYKDGFDDDPTGRAALEKTLNADLKTIETDWAEWIAAIEPPWRSKRRIAAWLGVRMEDAEGGVRITGFVRGSPAGRAKVLKRGDVIVSIAGIPTPGPRELTRAVQTFRPGQTVEVEVIREDRTQTVRQTLGLIPR